MFGEKGRAFHNGSHICVCHTQYAFPLKNPARSDVPLRERDKGKIWRWKKGKQIYSTAFQHFGVGYAGRATASVIFSPRANPVGKRALQKRCCSPFSLFRENVCVYMQNVGIFMQRPPRIPHVSHKRFRSVVVAEKKGKFSGKG